MNIPEIILSVFFVAMLLLYSSWIILFFMAKTREKKFLNENEYPTISIILPTHNEERCISETLKSVLDARYPKTKEIIVVNDGSTDKTEKIVREISEKNKEVKLINVTHAGKANAINQGTKIAKNEILIVLDADSRVDENALLQIVEPFSDEKVGAVSGIIKTIDEKNILVWFQDFEYVLSSAWRYLCNNLNATYILPGFAAIRKNALLAVGGFSADTFSEDFEIGLRLKKAGFKLDMSNAIIYTKVPTTLKDLMRQRMRWGLGTIQVVRKHSDVPLNRKFGAVGLYGIPTQLYWYIHSVVVLPITFYQIFGGYYQYFASFKNFFSFEVLKYFFGWFSAYGMLEYSYNSLIGEYGVSPFFYLVFIVFFLNMFYNLIAILKFSKPKLRYLFTIFFFFPYSILVLLFYLAPLISEFKGNKKGNKWDK